MDRDNELLRRMKIWRKLKSLSPSKDGKGLAPSDIRDLKVLSGFRGISRSKTSTDKVSQDGNGVTVGVLHTGAHYDDDIDDSGVLYHYPVTKQPGMDRGDVEATKNCKLFELPLFVVTRPTISSKVRDVMLGWVTEWDDNQNIFLIEYGETPSTSDIDATSEPFVAVSKKPKKETLSKVRSGQCKFRFRLIQRYGMECIVSGVDVDEMLIAAHIIPYAEGGSMDPRNGLLLSANLHNAFDAGLWAIHPETLEVVTKPDGPSKDRLGIKIDNLQSLTSKPAKEALLWAWTKTTKDW